MSRFARNAQESTGLRARHFSSRRWLAQSAHCTPFLPMNRMVVLAASPMILLGSPVTSGQDMLVLFGGSDLYQPGAFSTRLGAPV